MNRPGRGRTNKEFDMFSIANPIPAAILEKYGSKVTRDLTTLGGYGLLFGFDAERARLTVEYGPQAVVAYVMSGDLDFARREAQRIALARDALPTRSERSAVPYRERLTRSVADHG
jgi:hypothetical protein